MLVPKLHALPRPVAAILPDPGGKSDKEWRLELDRLLAQREPIFVALGILDKQIERVAQQLCGAGEMQDVEDYNGEGEVSKEFVQRHQRSVGMLRWRRDITEQFERPGNVNGRAFGTGALIRGNRLLTAGHCFDQDGHGYTRPQRNRRTIERDEIARLMEVDFNFQKIKGENREHVPMTFPIVQLLEHRPGALRTDCAIVQLGPDNLGRMPNDVFGELTLAAVDLTTQDAILCIIQHPHGELKKVEAGRLLGNQFGRISYNDIDVAGGASGAPVLHPLADGSGVVVGIHTHGGCADFSGANGGVSIGAIRKLVKPENLDG